MMPHSLSIGWWAEEKVSVYPSIALKSFSRKYRNLVDNRASWSYLSVLAQNVAIEIIGN
jgi:hypothetical protein